jgi:hypothetical protein
LSEHSLMTAMDAVEVADDDGRWHGRQDRTARRGSGTYTSV